MRTYGGDFTTQTGKTVYQGIDASGIKLSHTDLGYNLQGRLAQSDLDTDGDGTTDSTVTYTYDADGMRVGKTADGTVVLYLVDSNNATGYGQVLEETNGTGQLLRSYTLGLDLISQTEADGTTYNFLYDGHGSTRALLNSLGVIVPGQTFAYDAYGNAHGFDPALALTILLYSGEKFDIRIQQQYLGARYYDLATGTFNRVDPFFGNLKDPQSLHKYLYTHANPINRIDPSGLFGIAGLSAGIGMSQSISNIKISADLAVFDAVTTTISGIQAGQNAQQILGSFMSAPCGLCDQLYTGSPLGRYERVPEAWRERFSQ